MVEWIVCIHPLSRWLPLLMHQFVFIGNPSDSGEGNFEPAAFALFVVQMNEIDTVVNVFFDETILPEESTVRQGALQALMRSQLEVIVITSIDGCPGADGGMCSGGHEGRAWMCHVVLKPSHELRCWSPLRAFLPLTAHSRAMPGALWWCQRQRRRPQGLHVRRLVHTKQLPVGPLHTVPQQHNRARRGPLLLLRLD